MFDFLVILNCSWSRIINNMQGEYHIHMKVHTHRKFWWSKKPPRTVRQVWVDKVGAGTIEAYSSDNWLSQDANSQFNEMCLKYSKGTPLLTQPKRETK